MLPGRIVGVSGSIVLSVAFVSSGAVAQRRGAGAGANDETAISSSRSGLNSDAYATGMTLVALHDAADIAPAEPLYRRGVQYLLGTQETDGSWLVSKRAYPENAYFESGFPHGKFQFISFAGTCWATMALSLAAAGR